MDPSLPPPTEPELSLGWLPLLLQTADALFPTGAYAHSLGFEECVRLGLVHDEGTLATFLREHIAPSLQRFELPYLRFAYEAALAHDFGTLAVLDQEIGASKFPREIRESSVQLGRRRLYALQNILPGEPRLAACAAAIGIGRMAGHHLTICAVQGAIAGQPLAAVLLAYYYQTMASVAGASLKLIRLGQEGMQRALRAVAAEAAGMVESSLHIRREEAGAFDPLLEIASMRHERAHERLFIS